MQCNNCNKSITDIHTNLFLCYVCNHYYCVICNSKHIHNHYNDNIECKFNPSGYAVWAPTTCHVPLVSACFSVLMCAEGRAFGWYDSLSQGRRKHAVLIPGSWNICAEGDLPKNTESDIRGQRSCRVLSPPPLPDTPTQKQHQFTPFRCTPKVHSQTWKVPRRAHWAAVILKPYKKTGPKKTQPWGRR